MPQQKDNSGPVVLALFGGLLVVMWLLFREKLEVVTSRLIGPAGPCSKSFQPTVLGIAPELLTLGGFPKKVAYWTDPASGCRFAASSNPENDVRQYAVVSLSDAVQIAESAAANVALNSEYLAAKVSGTAWTPGAVVGPALPTIYATGPKYTCPIGSHVEDRKGQMVCVVNSFLQR